MTTGVDPSRRARARDIAIAVILGAHGLALLFRIPWTLRRLWRVLRPGGGGIPDSELEGFGSRDVRFRSWYLKIARDYRIRGRFGYAWDDGLGLPLGVRIYNNWATYALLARLGTRRMAALGLILMAATAGALVGVAFGPLWGVPAGLVVAASPLIAISYTHLGKPEVFWWFGALLGGYLGFAGHPLAAGLAWSGLALVSLPVAALTAMILGPAMLLAAMPDHVVPLLAGMGPGVLKIVARLIPMVRSRFLAAVVSEQTGLWKRGRVPTIKELVWIGPFVLAVALAAPAAGWGVGSALMAAGAGLYWANHRIIYLNDAQSFHLALWTAAVGLASASGSVPALVAALIMAYNAPRFCGMPDDGAEDPVAPDPWTRRRRAVGRRFRRFPALEAVGPLAPAPLTAFFDRIPDGARVLVETEGDLRDASAFRGFWTWASPLLERRGIEQVNNMYTRMVEPDLAARYLSRFNAASMSTATMERVVDALGVSFVIAFTPGTVDALATDGYVDSGRVDLGPMTELRRYTRVPPATLTLLRRPRPGSVLVPDTDFRIEGSRLRWTAPGPARYTVRYRYSPGFAAHHGGRPIPVRPAAPLDDVPLEFMSVDAPAAGEVVLEYRAGWLR